MAHKPVLAAFLMIQEVQTRLEVAHDAGATLDEKTLRQMSMKLETARTTLQRAMLEAARILEEGAPPS